MMLFTANWVLANHKRPRGQGCISLATAAIESILQLTRPGKAKEGEGLKRACIAGKAADDFFGQTTFLHFNFPVICRFPVRESRGVSYLTTDNRLEE